MTVRPRECCTKIEHLLDEAPPMSDEDIMYACDKGLPNDLQKLLNHDDSNSHKADLACKVAGEDKPPCFSAEPMSLAKSTSSWIKQLQRCTT
eukprot:1156733-Pelagomonas_calceolata.AAC.5